MGVLAAVAVSVISLILLANLTSAPGPEGTDTTIAPLNQPTTTVAFAHQDDPITWISMYHMQSPQPIAYIDRSGTMFVFANVDHDEHGFGVGLVVHSSPDGHTWKRVGVGLEDRRIGTVIGARFGFLALGGEGGDDDGRAWMSTDGVTWDEAGPPELNFADAVLAARGRATPPWSSTGRYEVLGAQPPTDGS